MKSIGFLCIEENQSTLLYSKNVTEHLHIPALQMSSTSTISTSNKEENQRKPLELLLFKKFVSPQEILLFVFILILGGDPGIWGYQIPGVVSPCLQCHSDLLMT